jgi:hypothetical protein
MATFPALIPSARTYIPGEYPHTPHSTYSGSQVRVRHLNAVMGARLRLFFPALTTSEMLEIKAHYAGQRGGFVSFDIPDELLSGADAPASFTPAGQKWKYTARPQVKDISVDGDSPSNFHDVTVELASTPEKPVIYVPRVVYRLTALAPEVVGLISSVDVPGLTYELQVYSPTVMAASGGSIDVGAITYSQSSVYAGNSAATNAGMTNGVFAESVQTATNNNPTEWIQMDFGAVYPVANIVVGCDFSNTLAGGWGKTYSENLPIEYSPDGSSWTAAGNTGTFSAGIKTISVSFNARYVRVTGGAFGYAVVTEFYATST